MSVLHVIAPGPAGGAEGIVRALAVGHRRGGCPAAVAAVLSMGEADPPLLAELAEGGVPVFPIRVAPRAYRAERRTLAALVRRLRPRVLHTHGYRADVIDQPVARAFGVPVVSTVHGFTGGGWRNGLYERLQLRALRSCEAVVAVSAPLQRRLVDAGVPPQRVHLVPNAPPPGAPLLDRGTARRRLDVPRGAYHLGWVGRLSREKGPDLFLEAVAALPDLPLVASMVGDGPERTRLVRLAQRLGLDERVRWHGAMPRAVACFAGLDLLVLSSRTEGTPLVLLEAMAAGVPIVATAVGGVPDMLPDGHALLVPPDAPALAAAIRRARLDPAATLLRADRARLGFAARFCTPRWLRRHLEIYDEIAGAAAPSDLHASVTGR